MQQGRHDTDTLPGRTGSTWLRACSLGRIDDEEFAKATRINVSLAAVGAGCGDWHQLAAAMWWATPSRQAGQLTAGSSCLPQLPVPRCS